MELKVIKKFNGIAEGRILSPGETIQTNDIQRINALVQRGYCEITSLESQEQAENSTERETIEYNGGEYPVEDVKAAIASVGVKIAPNAKKKATEKVLASLTDEQQSALLVVLRGENADSSNE